MTRRGRTILGFVVAPLAPAIAFTPFAMVGLGPLGLILGVYAIGLNAVFAYPVAVAAGVPVYLLCQRLRWSGLGLYFCCGLALGGCMGYAASATSLSGQSVAGPAPAVIGAGAFCGALATICFWLIARPDRAPRP